MTQETPIFKIEEIPRIQELPSVRKEKLDVTYPLIPPYAYARIYWDQDNKELIYKVIEPELSKEERYVLNLLEDGIRELINISYIATKEGETVIQYLEKNIRVLLDELRIKLTSSSYLKIMYYVYRDFVGLGKIEPLLTDFFIEDIECNGINSEIYVVHRVYRNLKTNIIYETIEELRNFVERIAQKCNKYISYATPLLDGSLPDGSRVNATYTEEISTKGPTFSIRKFTKVPWTPTQLIQLNTTSPRVLAYLWLLIEHEKNIMILGGTASGKTTLLNGLTFFIPPSARVVSIEDTRELSLYHTNWLPSVARAGVGLANIIGQKYGEVTLFDLLKESFRQRPDYVIIGEIRGKEAFVLFQGMASGHPSLGTMHADSVDTMIKRLITPPINLSASLVESLDAVCVINQAKIKGYSVRRVREISEIKNVDEQTKQSNINQAFIWDPKTDAFNQSQESEIFKKIAQEQGIDIQVLQRELELRTRLLQRMYETSVFSPQRVTAIINEYYKDPNIVLSRFNII